MVVDFSRHLGVAFQILNDLKDWDGDSDNKLIAGQDVLAGRPTLLLALALEGLTGGAKGELLHLLHRDGDQQRTQDPPAVDGETVAKVRRLFEQASVFEKADKLVEKYRARAEAIADEVEPNELRELLYYLVDTVLERQTAEEPAALPLVSLNLVS
jgi:geranylgeranyl pyrophosphate synthase